MREILDKVRTKIDKEDILEKKKAERLERNLYVKNLNAFIESERLRTIFRKFGFIHSAKVMTGVLGRSRAHL